MLNCNFLGNLRFTEGSKKIRTISTKKKDIYFSHFKSDSNNRDLDKILRQIGMNIVAMELLSFLLIFCWQHVKLTTDQIRNKFVIIIF